MKKLRRYNKKIKSTILGVFAVFLAIIAIGKTYATTYTNLDSTITGDAKDLLTLSTYKCPSKDVLEEAGYYNDGEWYPATDEGYASGCMDALFIDEEISPSSYAVAEGGAVDTESMILVLIHYNYTGSGENTVQGISGKLKYNTTALDFIGTEESVTYGINSDWYPYTAGKKSNTYYWGESNIKIDTSMDEKPVSFILDTDTGYLNDDQHLIIFPFLVKEDASAGSSLSFSLMGDGDTALSYQTWNTNNSDSLTDNNAQIFGASNSTTVKVAGGSTSTDNTLKSLKVSSLGTTYTVDSTTPFTTGAKTVKTYLYYVPNGTSTIDIDAVANDTKVTSVVGSDPNGTTLTDNDSSAGTISSESNAINVGMNSFTVAVTAASGDVETYTINVYRLNNDTSLKSLTTSGISLTLQSDGITYKGTTDYNTTSTTVSAVVADNSNATVASGAGTWTFTSSGATANKRDVVVQAENCNSKYTSITGNSCTATTYKLEIARAAASDVATLSDLKVNGTTISGFASGTTEYNYGNVSNATNSLTIAATKTNADATIDSGVGTCSLSVGDNQCKVHVTAQDGTTTKEYVINVRRLSNEIKLNTLTVTSNPSGSLTPSFTSDNTSSDYTYTYDPTVTSVTISATVKDVGKATIDIMDGTSGLPSSPTYISNTDTLTVNVPDKTAVYVMVKAEDGTLHNYKIILTRQKDSNNYLSNLKVEYTEDSTTKTATLSPTFTAATEGYTATVPADIDTVVVTPTRQSNYSKVTKIGTQTSTTGLANATITGLTFGTNSIPVVVSNESGNLKTYTITLTRSKYDIKTLDDLTIGDGFTTTFASGTTSYTYGSTVPFATTSLPISGTKTNSYASVSVKLTDAKGTTTTQSITESTTDNTFSGTLNIPTGTSKVTITVTAHDGTTQDYTVDITRTKNNDNSITSLRVEDQVAEPEQDASDPTVYHVQIPYSKTSVQPAEVAVGISSDATLTKGSAVTGITTTAESSFTFTVTAEDGTDKNYTVKIIRKSNNEGKLLKVELATVPTSTTTPSCTIADGETACTIGVPTSTTNFVVSSTVSDNATKDIADGTSYTMPATDPTKTFTITVTSEDGTDVNAYVITVERTLSTVNTLSDLAVDDATVSGFTPSTNFYTNTQLGTVESVTVKATVSEIGKEEVTKAKVNGTEVTVSGEKSTGIYTFDADLSFGSNAVVITVKAENGQTQNYNLTITRSARSNAELSDISYRTSSDTAYATIIGYTQATGSYTLPTVDYDTTSIDFKVTPDDDLGSAIISSVTDANDNVTASNVTDTDTTDGKIYTASVDLSTGKNVITIVGTAHNGTTTKSYTLTIYRDKNDDNTFSDLKVKGVEATLSATDPKTYEVTLPNSDTKVDTTATPSDITLTLPSGATVAFTPASKDLVTTAVNIITMVVTSENGTPETYTINVTREKAVDTTLTIAKVTVTSTETSENGKILTCDFTSTSKECEIDVPTSTNGFSFDLEGTALTSGTTDPVVPKTYIMDASSSTIEIPIVVTAEDGTTTDNYKVTVNRSKSSNNNLSDLSYKTDCDESVPYTTVTGFTPGTTLYRIQVDGDTEEIYLNATVQDTGKAKVTTDLSNPFLLSLGRQNQIEIVVEAENGSTTKYYVIVTRNRRTDATLSMIKVDTQDIAEFTPGTTEYTIADVPYSTTSINVEGILNDQDEDSNAKVTGGGVKNLTTGENTITLTVTADDGTTTKQYTVHVNREKNNSTDITAIKVGTESATYNETLGIWEITVPNSVSTASMSNVVVTPAAGATSTDALATYSLVSTELSTQNTTDVNITVTAEDGTTDIKTLRVTRTKSSVSTLHTLSVDGGSFSPSFVADSNSTVRYTVTIPESYTSITINGTPTDSNAEVVGFGTFNFAGNTTYTVNVTSEDETDSTTYYLEVVRASSSVNTLKSLVVSSGTVLGGDYVSYTLVNVTDGTEGFSSEVVAYKVTLPGNIDTVTISAETSDPRATITNASTALGEHTYSVGTHSQQIRVQSESGSAQTYFLTIERLAKPYNNLATLEYATCVGSTCSEFESVPAFDPEVDTYTLNEVNNDVASIKLQATAEDADDASINGTGTCDLVVGDNECTVVVTAQNGDKKTYTVKVKRKASDNNLLSLLSVSGYSISPSFNSGTNEYTVTVKSDKATLSPSEVTAIAADSTAKVEKSETINLVANTYVAYEVKVTSASGRENTYRIRVFRPYSSDATLSSVNLTNATLNGTITNGVLEYTIYVPHGTTSFTIHGVPTVSTTQVTSGDGEYFVATTSSVEIVTLAEDNTTTLTYKFNVEEALSNDASLSTLYVMGYPFVGTYTSFIPAIGTYDIGDIDYSVNALTVIATATNTSSSIKYYVNGVLQTNNEVVLPPGTGSGNVTVQVMAADGHTTKNYTITYNKIYSTNAYLAYLGVDGATMTPTFSKATDTYSIIVSESVNELKFTMYTEDDNATMTINSGSPVSGTAALPYEYTLTNLVTGSNTLTIVVNPQDSSASGKTYNVIVRKSEPAANSDSTLEMLEVEDYPFTSVGGYTTTTFDKTVTDYHIGTLNLKTDKLKINYRATQGTSTTSILVGGTVVTPDSDGYITIPEVETANSVVTVQVVAPNGTSITNYNIHYAKVANTNAFLASIVVSNGTLDVPFYRETYSYKDTVSDDTLTETITITPEVETSTIQVGGSSGTTYTTFPAVYSITGITAGTKEIPITVTSESGNIAYYYVNIYKEGAGEVITSDTHGHTIDATYISTVAPNKTSDDLKGELDNDNSKLEIWKADDSAQIGSTDLVGTGMIVKLIIGGVENDRKIVVVKGDTNGDGKITITDVVKTLNHYLGKVALPDAPYIEAAEVSGDGKITITDVVKTLNHYLGKVLITTYK